MAASLAGVWLAAGAAAIVIGLWLRPAVLPVILGLMAAAYGWVWARVAMTGERQPWPRRRTPQAARRAEPGRTAPERRHSDERT